MGNSAILDPELVNDENVNNYDIPDHDDEEEY